MRATAGIFGARGAAERAARELAARGIAAERISVLTPGDGQDPVATVPTVEAEPPGFGRTLGGVVGAAAGAGGGVHAATVLSAAVPGVGPVIALGVAGAALLGAAGVAVGGALSDALRDGLPRDELFVYEDALRRGRSVVIALADGRQEQEAAREALERAGAESIDAARERWWIGLRDVEAREWAGGDCAAAESRYRQGFEAALLPVCRGRGYEDACDELARRYPEGHTDPVFRRGYERGLAYEAALRAGGARRAEEGR
jgi:hypothetical protein